MSLFANLNNTGLEESQDRLGGYQPLNTDIYTGQIKAAYAGKSAGGAQSVSLIVAIGDQEYRETLYITNRKGENFYVKDGKKIPLPDFTTIDDICLVTSGKPLSEQPCEDKVIKLYDKDAKKELPKTVPMLTELIGLDVTLGILRQTVNKTEKVGEEYVPVADGSTRDQNVIDKVFHTGTKMTVVEARQGAEEAKFHDSWKERNAGKTQDRRELKEGGAQVGAPKRPGAPATAPQAGTAGAPRKSLFGSSK
jgi:hypothetical protein